MKRKLTVVAPPEVPAFDATHGPIPLDPRIAAQDPEWPAKVKQAIEVELRHAHAQQRHLEQQQHPRRRSQ
jgi:hypothetical protein